MLVDGGKVAFVKLCKFGALYGTLGRIIASAPWENEDLDTTLTFSVAIRDGRTRFGCKRTYMRTGSTSSSSLFPTVDSAYHCDA